MKATTTLRPRHLALVLGQLGQPATVVAYPDRATRAWVEADDEPLSVALVGALAVQLIALTVVGNLLADFKGSSPRTLLSQNGSSQCFVVLVVEILSESCMSDFFDSAQLLRVLNDLLRLNGIMLGEQ